MHPNHEPHGSEGSKLHKQNKMPNLPLNSRGKRYNPDNSDDANGEDDAAEEDSVQFFFSDDLIRESAANKKIYGYVDQILPTVRSVILKK